jgi:hypothetical protein
MTERKPRQMPVESWVEHQISRAMREGKFDDLPGAGKPIPDLLKPETDLDFAAKLARREGIDATVFLPPALALAKEVEVLPERLAKEHQEGRVRDYLEDLNARIRRERLKPQDGPMFRVKDVDVEAAVEGWHAARPAPAVLPAPPPVEPHPTSLIWLRFRRRSR